MWDVVYVHECPRSGRKVLLTIQYDDADHEARNLSHGRKEHYCWRCRQPMTRLGHAVDVRQRGDGEDFLHHTFYDQPEPISGPDHELYETPWAEPEQRPLRGTGE